MDAELLANSNPFAITTVISLCEEGVLRRAQEINYLHFSIEDASPLDIGTLDAVLDSIAENISRKHPLGKGISTTESQDAKRPEAKPPIRALINTATMKSGYSGTTGWLRCNASTSKSAAEGLIVATLYAIHELRGVQEQMKSKNADPTAFVLFAAK